MWDRERGQSETIGNVLLIGVVVITATITGAVIVSNLSGSDTGPLFETSVSVSDDRVEICHTGGDVVKLSEVRVSIGGQSVPFTESRAVGELSETFSPGDCRVLAYDQSGSVSVVVATDQRIIEQTEASEPTTVPGLRYEYYENSSYTSLEESWDDVPEKTGVTDGFDLSLRDRNSNFAFNFTGTVYAPTDGEYTFETWSDDGSRLYINGGLVVDNGGRHANQSAQGTIELTSGTHDITVTQFENTGEEALRVNWAGPGFGTEQLDDAYLSSGSTIVPRYSVDCDGLTCSFDASNTSSEEPIDSYEWSFPGGTVTSDDATVTRTFGSGGTYDVELTVVTESDSTSVQKRVKVLEPESQTETTSVSEGLTYRYYTAENQFTSLPSFDTLTPKRMGTTDSVTVLSNRGSDFAFEYEGYIDIPSTDTYTFSTVSDDGSQLYINGTKVVENGGTHPPTEQSGQIALKEGNHSIRVVMFERGGGETIEAYIDSDDMAKHELTNLTSEGIVPEFSTDCTGTECTFDAGPSSVAAGDSIQSYDWTFDGSTTVSGKTVTHEFGTAGTYDVELSITAGDGTETINESVTVEELRAADNPSSTADNLSYSYYEADGTFESLPDFDNLTADRTGTTATVELKSPREDNFAYEYQGYVEVPEDAEYTFLTESDDGSRLYIGSELVVQNDGTHSRRKRSGTIGLQAGKHEIRIVMFEHTGVESIDAYIDSDSMTEHELTNVTHADGS